MEVVDDDNDGDERNRSAGLEMYTTRVGCSELFCMEYSLSFRFSFTSVADKTKAIN